MASVGYHTHIDVLLWLVCSTPCVVRVVAAVFLAMLLRHAASIRLDQSLYVQDQGNTAATNPVFHIRKRYRELYSLYRPEVFWWRIVLMLRKFCEVAVALMFSSKPLFQAW